MERVLRIRKISPQYLLNSKHFRQRYVSQGCCLPDDARQLTGTVESLPSYSETVFIATPPLFVLKPDKNTKIRINRVGGSLPADRESLFILNVAALPTLENSHSVKTDNQLQIAVRNRMKIFYRPSNLSEDPNMSYQKLRWARKMKLLPFIIQPQICDTL